MCSSDLTLQSLNSRLGSDDSFGNGSASCFDPHLGIVYFSQGKPCAWINVCMECNRMEPSLPLQAMKQGEQKGPAGTYYIGEGMSPAFRQFLNSILKKQNFSHIASGDGLFD